MLGHRHQQARRLLLDRVVKVALVLLVEVTHTERSC